MMPRRVVTLHRWQIGAAFVALAASYVVMGVLLKGLSDGRVQDRKRADFNQCVYVRDHIVKPDRQTVLTGPYAATPTLKALGFDAEKIEAYLRNQYGGVDPKLLEAKPPDGLGLTHARAVDLTTGPPDGVAVELKRRPIPDCAARYLGAPHK